MTDQTQDRLRLALRATVELLFGMASMITLAMRRSYTHPRAVVHALSMKGIITAEEVREAEKVVEAAWDTEAAFAPEFTALKDTLSACRKELMNLLEDPEAPPGGSEPAPQQEKERRP